MCCPDHQTISAFADGELEADQAAEMQRHIAKCPGCRQLVEEQRWLADCGRSALRAIHVGEAPTPAVAWSRPLWLGWEHPVSLAAAAAVVLVLSIGTWFTASRFSRHQAALTLHPMASITTTSTGRNGQSMELEDAAFEQWAAPYRELGIPLVSMEVAESYHPDPILPILPDTLNR